MPFSRLIKENTNILSNNLNTDNGINKEDNIPPIELKTTTADSDRNGNAGQPQQTGTFFYHAPANNNNTLSRLNTIPIQPKPKATVAPIKSVLRVPQKTSQKNSAPSNTIFFPLSQQPPRKNFETNITHNNNRSSPNGGSKNPG